MIIRIDPALFYATICGHLYTHRQNFVPIIIYTLLYLQAIDLKPFGGLHIIYKDRFVEL